MQITHPTSRHPGALSTITGLPYNENNNLLIYQHRGYQDSKVYKYKFEKSECKNEDYPSDEFQRFNPPNMIRFAKNKYVDQTEITNLHWAEFVHHIKKDSGSALYLSLLPDPNNLPTPDYFTDPFYRYYPVVGITKDQAKVFNQWRRNVVVERFNKVSGKSIEIEIRLPTIDEFNSYSSLDNDSNATKYGLTHFTGFIEVNNSAIEYLYQKNNEQIEKDTLLREIHRLNSERPRIPLFNVKSTYDILGDITPNYVYEYPPNCKEIFGTVGNVAEMVLEEDFVKGGHHNNTLEECNIERTERVALPSKFIGFRSVGVLKID